MRTNRLFAACKWLIPNFSKVKGAYVVEAGHRLQVFGVAVLAVCVIPLLAVSGPFEATHRRIAQLPQVTPTAIPSANETSPPRSMPSPSPTSTPQPSASALKQLRTDQAITDLEHKSILRGNRIGEITPPNQPIPVTQFLVLIQRALCINTLGATTVGPRSKTYYAVPLMALNAYVPTNSLDPHPQQRRYVSRQDAVVYAVHIASATHSVQLDALPAHFPKFADEDQINPGARYAAKLAAYLHLVRIDPDNTFHPRDRLSSGDSAVLADTLNHHLEDQPNALAGRRCP